MADAYSETARLPTSSASIPIMPLGLGLAGLLPFWGLAVGLALHGAYGFDPHALDLALVTYAAIILSFLGGIRWGVALDGSGQGANFVLSIVPSLAAWACLLTREPWRLALLGAIALALGPIDVGLVRDGLAPRWFGRLRLILSAGAGVALLLGALASR